MPGVGEAAVECGAGLHAAEKNAIADAGSNWRLWEEQLKDRYLLQEHVGNVAVPALALCRSRDKVFNVSGAQTLKTLLSGVDLRVLRDGGHLPMMEKPGKTAQMYADFLRTASARRQGN